MDKPDNILIVDDNPLDLRVAAKLVEFRQRQKDTVLAMELPQV